ncbi:MAG: sulfatase-like hydrolase/transferase, partial [Elusimicrobia bacterium]|nr:sulfatase-like hydrolase/transferase [Elusimicrobiota bacterium]
MAVFLSTAAAFAILAAAAPGEPARKPNVIVVLVDTLRADHLGCYGYKGPISPSVDAFSKSCVVFDRCITPAPWTKPAVASVFTSLYPAIHRVINP